MARTFTLAQVEVAVRQRADALQASNSPGQAEVWSYISSAYTELYDLLVQTGFGYGDTSTTITATGLADEYVLPADFYATVGVERQIDAASGAYDDPLPLANPLEVPRYSRRGMAGTDGMTAQAFRILGSGATTRIALYPRPGAGIVYRVRYAAAPTDLTTPSATLDGISGWEELVVIESARRILQKEGFSQAVADLKDDANSMRARIREMAMNRNLHQSVIVADVTGMAGSVDFWDCDIGDRWPR